MAQLNCRFFSGYKPCGKGSVCNEDCSSRDIVRTSLLIIHLGALGAVVRSTALLKAMKRKFPASRITWVTDRPAEQLLIENPLIDRVLTTHESDLLALSTLHFDVAFVIDKSLKASGVLKRTTADMVYGFTVDSHSGAIIPATEAANELWELGIDNHKKFFVNEKPESRLICEALELEYRRDSYYMPLSAREMGEVQRRSNDWRGDDDSTILVGINTGCSNVIAAKKLSVDFQRRLIQRLALNTNLKIVLLGGPEDIERNNQIADGLPVIRSSENLGLRDGYVSVSSVDIVVTGDSLGMHMAIAAAKQVVAWFGPTCAHEIDLFNRGESILSEAPCGPCWKRQCQEAKMCYDLVSMEKLLSAIDRQIKKCQKSNREPDAVAVK